jgi:hypothetical protein
MNTSPSRADLLENLYVALVAMLLLPSFVAVPPADEGSIAQLINQRKHLFAFF